MNNTSSLLSSFNYFESLFNNAEENTVILMDEKGIIITVNTAFTNYFGYTNEDVAGKHFSLLFTDEDQKKGMPENELKNVISTGQSSDNNYLVSKDKNITWVSGESVLVKSNEDKAAIVKIIQSIHQQKISEISLQRLNDFNENVLGSIEDVVIVLDEQLNVVKANTAFSMLFKYKEGERKMVSFTDLIKPYDVAGLLQNNIQNALRSKKEFLNTPIEIAIVSGEKRMFDVSFKPLQQQPEDDKNIVLVMHDITVHKQAEREREDLIGFVAHELRNPLANLILCNEILGEAIKDNNEEEINDMLQRSRNNILRLKKMIAELYEAAKTNSGNFKLDISTFNFKDMLKEATDTIEILQPSYKIVLEGDADIEVKADRYRLIQVVTNYVSNGIKYSAGNTDVILTINKTNEEITVSVKDEGLGISPKQLPYIFERFFRAEKTKNLEGIGLGLYLCRQIIHAHQGKVWAESEEGKGSIFYFSIPINM